jgi:hypothetical protein
MLDAEHDDSFNHTAYNNRNYAEVSNCSEHLQHSQYINVIGTSVHPSVQLSIQCQIEAILNCSKPIQSLLWIVDSMPIRSRRRSRMSLSRFKLKNTVHLKLSSTHKNYNIRDHITQTCHEWSCE